MKTSAIRVIIAIAAITTIALVFRLWQRLSERPVTIAEPSVGQSFEMPSTLPVVQAREASGPIQDLTGQLDDERRGRQRAEAEAVALPDKMANLQSNVVVSLGTVEEMGKRAGAFLPFLSEVWALTGRDPGTLSPDEKRRLLGLQRDHAQLLGALPEITRFQDNPGEYGRFFSSMLQEAAGLTDPQAAQIEAYMRERATVMKQLELNAAKESTDSKLEQAWEERRDKFNEQTVHGLKALLPLGAAEKAAIDPELMKFLEMDFDKLNTILTDKKGQ